MFFESSDDSNDSFFLFEPSDSDDSDECNVAQINIPVVRNEKFLEETVPRYDEQTFFIHFRVSRRIAIDISERYSGSTYFNKDSYGAHGKISAFSQVLIYLWFVGHQTSSFRDVSDRFNISLSSLHRIINRLTVFISNLSPQIIRWPNEDNRKESEAFFRQKGFPNAIGAIDGCHILIDKPEVDSDSYINRKGQYSIQMQAVCDHRNKIIDVFIGYPGSVHDSRVFKNSPLYRNLPERCGSYVLLGDSGYPLLNNLMTPYKDRGQLTRRQLMYNIKLSKSRYVIEHTFGILKQKFRQLFHIKLRNISLIVNFIRACCVLHNIALDDEFVCEEPQRLGDEPNLGFYQDEVVDDVNARGAREIITNLIFDLYL